ncbi:hypothetical protein PV664_36000 [Streptomyces sp. ME01-18a]|uniref:hypothetical protein n=1 Tax=Streptomyces sp. ME01-18a TaxID=3028669 RepID=UPI0029AF6442|nr:hypothetical protein [Streptomyces sp. ME01-18a]MDX3434255.1 hypothetical protein [Streptomyces sp. ME01-18a]
MPSVLAEDWPATPPHADPDSEARVRSTVQDHTPELLTRWSAEYPAVRLALAGLAVVLPTYRPLPALTPCLQTFLLQRPQGTDIGGYVRFGLVLATQDEDRILAVTEELTDACWTGTARGVSTRARALLLLGQMLTRWEPASPGHMPGRLPDVRSNLHRAIGKKRPTDDSRVVLQGTTTTGTRTFLAALRTRRRRGRPVRLSTHRRPVRPSRGVDPLAVRARPEEVEHVLDRVKGQQPSPPRRVSAPGQVRTSHQSGSVLGEHGLGDVRQPSRGGEIEGRAAYVDLGVLHVGSQRFWVGVAEVASQHVHGRVDRLDAVVHSSDQRSVGLGVVTGESGGADTEALPGKG